MPLHSESETLRLTHPHRLHRTIGGAAFRHQCIGETRHALPVQGVYLNRPCAQQIFESAARLQEHIMRGPILDIERIILVFPVIEAGRKAGFRRLLMDVLMERAAEGDVHFLKATADGEKRHPTFDAVPDERQRQRVPLTVEEHTLARGRAAIILGMDVRVGTGKKYAVAKGENLVELVRRLLEGLSRYRQEDRLTIGASINGGEVFLAHSMKGVRPQHFDVAGDTNNRAPM